MASSTTNLDLISSSQASKEITANALFDAESPAALFGRRASTTANLTWGYYGGAMSVNGIVTAIPNGTKTLTNGATNYLEADPTTGNVAVNTSNFTAANIPLYSVVTAGNVVTSYTDFRVASGPSYVPAVTLAATINAAADKNTPVGADKIAIIDSTNNSLKTTTLSEAAASLGVSGFPTVASNTSVDIFAAVGATINMTGNTTVTGIVACTATQVGSSKKIVPATGFSITASANIIVDGATSGTRYVPAGAEISVLATSTTSFKLCIIAKGSFTLTGTGFTANPSVTAYYNIICGVCTLGFPLISGTSNSTSFGLSGIPSECDQVTVSTQVGGVLFATDNGSSVTTQIGPITGGTSSLFVGGSASWTASGSKRLFGSTVSYQL
ncbi:MAG TPA: hypothetical protein VIY48_17920 [Candidatus Paceibacterota bacterium]